MAIEVQGLRDRVIDFFERRRRDAREPVDIHHAAHAIEDLPEDARDQGKRLLGLEVGTSFQRREIDELKDAVAHDWGELEVVLPFLSQFPKTDYMYDVSPFLARGDRPDAPKLQRLAEAGFTATLNLCKETRGGDREEIDEARLKGKLRHFHVGIVDGTPPSTSQVIDILNLLTALEAEDDARQELLTAPEGDDKHWVNVQQVNARTAREAEGKQRVYVHCEAGKGRTGVIVACYRMAVMGWDDEDALREAENFGCSTPDQLQFIRDFAAAQRDGRIDGYPRLGFGSVRATAEELAKTLESCASTMQPAG